MMYYANNKPKQITFELIDAAINHAVDFLGLQDVMIEIDFEKLGNVAANVDYDEDENTIEIVFNKDLCGKGDEFERTLFHELVHAKQILDGRLELGNPSKWMGIIYTCSYYELPWEKEAYALEEEMILSFKNS